MNIRITEYRLAHLKSQSLEQEMESGLKDTRLNWWIHSLNFNSTIEMNKLMDSSINRALIFQGGGSLGAYEAGAYKAIYEESYSTW